METMSFAVRNVSLIVVLFLLHYPIFAKASDGKDEIDLYIHQQEIALTVELERLATELDLDVDRFKEIQSSVEKTLKSGARKLCSHLSLKTKEACNAYGGILSRELADAIHSKAKEFINAERFADYREDYEKVIAWEDHHAQRYLLVFLDALMRFRPDQFEELEGRFAANWNPVWNFEAVQVSFEGYEVCKPVLEALENNPDHPKQFTELLTAKQLSIFNSLEKLALNYQKFTTIKPEEDFALVKAQLPLFLDRAVEELSESVELSDRAQMRLNVGYKGALISLARKRKAANLAYKKKSKLWEMSSFFKLSHQQLREEQIWKNAISGFMTPEQWAAHLEREQRHRDARYDIGVTFGIMFLHKNRRLKYKELTELHRLAVEEVRGAEETNLYRSTFVLFGLPDEFFEGVFEDETMKVIEPQLAKARLWKRE